MVRVISALFALVGALACLATPAAAQQQTQSEINQRADARALHDRQEEAAQRQRSFDSNTSNYNRQINDAAALKRLEETAPAREAAQRAREHREAVAHAQWEADFQRRQIALLASVRTAAYADELDTYGRKLLKEGDYEAALRQFKLAEGISISNANTYAREMRAYIGMGAYDEAWAVWQRTGEEDHNDTSIIVRGDIAYAKDDVATALALYNKASGPPGMVASGRVRMNSGDYAGALADFQKGLSFDKSDRASQAAIAVAKAKLTGTPPPAEAVETYEWDQPRKPPTPSLCDRLGAHPGDFTRPPKVPGVAITALDPAGTIAACTLEMQQNPSNWRAVFNLSRGLTAANRCDEARALRLQAIAHGHAMAMLAEAHSADSEPCKALGLNIDRQALLEKAALLGDPESAREVFSKYLDQYNAASAAGQDARALWAAENKYHEIWIRNIGKVAADGFDYGIQREAVIANLDKVNRGSSESIRLIMRCKVRSIEACRDF